MKKFTKFAATTLAAVFALTAAVVPAKAEKVIYTDDKTEVAEDFSNVNLSTLIPSTVASADLDSINITVDAADDVSLNEWTFLNLVVDVNGAKKEIKISGCGAAVNEGAGAVMKMCDASCTHENEWKTLTAEKEEDRAPARPSFTFDVAGLGVKAGDTFSVSMYTQSWAGAADYVFDVKNNTEIAAPAEDTEAPAEDATEAPAGDATEAPAGDATEAPATQAPATDNSAATGDSAPVAMAAVLMAAAATAIVVMKKKEA